MSADETTTTPLRRRSLLPLGIALVLVVILARIVSGAVSSGHVPSAPLQLLLSDLTAWIPLALGVVWFLRGRGTQTIVERLHLRIGVVDVFWAIAIACLARAVNGFLDLGVFGTTGFAPQPIIGKGPDIAVLVLTVLGPCIVSPIVEELFFRGTLQPALARRINGSPDEVAGVSRAAMAVSVVGTAVLFAAMHVLVANGTATGNLVTFVSTLVLGLLVGGLVAVTRRLGGAILAHVLFNAIAIALTWPR
jgi:membrane protease YdiL (CAAX protease family)